MPWRTKLSTREITGASLDAGGAWPRERGKTRHFHTFGERRLDRSRGAKARTGGNTASLSPFWLNRGWRGGTICGNKGGRP